MRERWFGATGRKVPQISVEGELDLEGALVVNEPEAEVLRAAFQEGQPIVVRADSPEAIHRALSRPEVSAVLVPAHRRDLLAVDLIGMTYGR
ncbi:MAG: hypothetical protein H0V79_07460 [Actinobacteria bacterium]|nr:hypothetical protein [Actinomycetota bacterium]